MFFLLNWFVHWLYIYVGRKKIGKNGNKQKVPLYSIGKIAKKIAPKLYGINGFTFLKPEILRKNNKNL